ncbi:Topoisomerase 1-associated factor 1 [Naganishia albida]|nr:Topoisomerase 1-associated factor 1 [Naganishia albida]
MEQNDQDEQMLGDEPREDEDEMVDRMEVFLPVVQSLVNALGGYEDIVDPESQAITTTYLPGDSCLAVLRDLKKLWRKDDTDDERTVFRCFHRCHLARELVALIEECVGRGDHERKIALAATDLLAALTWPIDVAQELKELAEDDADVVTDYASLLRAQVEYKMLLLKSNTLLRVMQLVIPCLARGIEKDKRIVSLMLHLARNLLAIRDPIANGQETGEKQELARLQSTLVLQLNEHKYFSLFLSLASNASTTMYNDFNVLILDCWFLIFRGTDPNELAKDQQRAPMENLTKLLDHESSYKRTVQRTGTSRHSRFGTTISISDGSNKYILHKQKAISNSAGGVIDSLKRRRALHPSHKKQRDELGRGTDYSVEAMLALQEYATECLAVFDAFFSSILRDIRLSRSKIRETDNLRALYLSRFFMEYLLAQRSKPGNVAQRLERLKAREARKAEKQRLKAMMPDKPVVPVKLITLEDLLAEKNGKAVDGDGDPSETGQPADNEDKPTEPESEEEEEEPIDDYDFGFVAEMFEEDALRWMMSRLNQAQENKAHVEYQACLDMSSILLSLTEAMQADPSEETKDAGMTLMDKLFYNGEFIENAPKTLKLYTNQSMSYLDSAIKFAYTLYSALEKYAKTRDDLHYRKRRAAQVIKLNADGTGELDEEAAPMRTAPMYTEHRRGFKDVERFLADEAVCKTLLHYLSLYKEYRDPLKMKRLVGLMHRIVVSLRKEGFFFKVSGLIIYKQLLDDQRSLPAHQSSKDAITLINYIMRKFFKSMEQDPFLAVEAFFPKASQGGSVRGFGAASGSEDDGDASDVNVKRARKKMERIPADLEFKPDSPLSWSQQVGTAILQLMESQAVSHVTWLIEQLGEISATRQQVILNTDGEPREYDPDLDDVPSPKGPSVEAMSKIEDFNIVHDTDIRAKEMTFNPQLKLLMTLSKLVAGQVDVTAEEPRVHWTMPKTVLPDDIDSTVRIMRDFLRNPIDLDGQSAKDLLRKKGKKPIKRAKRPAPANNSDDDEVGVERPKKRRKATKRSAELQHFKSAAYIEDSDDAAEADEAFFARELELQKASRQKMLAIGHIAPDDTRTEIARP